MEEEKDLGQCMSHWVGVCVLAGGGGRRYCRERARVIDNYFSTYVCSAASLGGTLFGGKSSYGERVAVEKNIFMQEDVFMEVLGWDLDGAREKFGEGKKVPARTHERMAKIGYCGGFQQWS